jgi:hypothetical protein
MLPNSPSSHYSRAKINANYTSRQRSLYLAHFWKPGELSANVCVMNEHGGWELNSRVPID